MAPSRSALFEVFYNFQRRYKVSYTTITRTKVSREYRETAIDAVHQFKEVALANGAVGVRSGMFMTGSSVNRFVQINFFETMAAVESTYAALSDAPITKEVMITGKFEIFGRGILKDLVHFGTQGSTEAKFIVLTMAKSEHSIEDEVKEFGNILADNGGTGGRLGKFVMGDYADGQTYLLGMGYPSLSAVQSAYDAVPADIADKVYKLASVQRRQLIRLF